MGNTRSRLLFRKNKRAKSRSGEPSVKSFHSNESLENETYHKPLTNDETDRLQEQEFIIQYIFNSKFSSPIEGLLREEARFLDIGCGPGTWLLDMASVYTDVLFFGVDCIASFPMSIKPSNVTFQQDDILSGLTMQDNSFDFVRMSLMCMSFTLDDYMFAIREALRVLKPGGYVEFFEVEHIKKYDGPMTDRIMKAFLSLLISKGIDLDVPARMPEILKSTNQLREVSVDKRRVCLGAKGGKQGTLYLDSMEYFFMKSLNVILSDIMGITVPEYIEYWKGVRREIEEGTTELTFCRFWAEKI